MEYLWRTEKILTIQQATQKADDHRAAGKKLVTVNGSFDLLQAGHLDFLEEAKQQGDVLFVGMNSDESVRSGKGPSRPIIPEAQRAALLAALACVDYVVIITGMYADEPHGSFLPAIRPGVHVNGSDYGDQESWVEYPVMQELGIRGYTVARRPNLSTSEIISKIQAL